jgi:predicted GNAT superfamily acetyltransferase
MTTQPLSLITIREIAQISEMRQVEELQKEIWGCDDREVLPTIAMIPITEVGGILLGAFERAEMVGFVLGFPGHDKGEPILHSDMLAVRPGYREHGLGYRLKLAQREQALAKGIKKITWTFDPLQSLNAYLNFGKLGVIADRYKINYYGETSSFLHRTGTDRLWVNWFLDSNRVKDRIKARDWDVARTGFEDGSVLVQVGVDERAVIKRTEEQKPEIIIEIPTDINSMLKEYIDLAVGWREVTRREFTRALAVGFQVEEFYLRRRGNQRIGAYLLRRENPV